MSKKRHCCLIWGCCYLGLPFFFFPFAFLLVFSLGFSPMLFCLSLACDECSNSFFCSSSASMAHSYSRRRTAPERSRSRDDNMWRNRRTQQHDWQQNPRPEQPPPAPRVRKVLVIVDIEQVRPLMNKTHDDSMAATTCEVLPRLTPVEERALFTYNILLNTHRLETFTVYNLLYCISQHIWYTWDRFYFLHRWTSDGKTILEIHLLSATRNTSLPI